MLASLLRYSSQVAGAVRQVFVALATHTPPSEGGR